MMPEINLEAEQEINNNYKEDRIILARLIYEFGIFAKFTDIIA
jgi:hypothetical protein